MNNISLNQYGIFLIYDLYDNKIYHNNFIDNKYKQVGTKSFYGSGNQFDDGYPSGGNYRSDYEARYPDAAEIDGSGIWDTPYIIDANNQDRYPLVNPWTPTLPPPENQPPKCVIKLQKDGVEISEIDVGEFFDIYVGDSTDDTGIKQVRFSSDDFQDNHPTGEWTEWYDWGTSLGDWNASTKIKRWSFTTPGYKVWAEVKDDIDQTDKRLARIYVPGSQPPSCVVELRKDGVKIDDIDAGQFFDVYVGDSTDDAAIERVMFSSDDSQDGVPTGEWTDWYNWNQHSGDWSALDKTMKWSFATGGKKEVWALIKDSDGNVVWNHTNIFAHPGYAIIVAGQGEWREKWSIDHGANNAYRALRNLGFNDDHIFYLNSEAPQDVDGDGDDEVDGFVSFSHFENTMYDVKNKIGSRPTPFVLYLTGHGDVDANNYVCFIFGDYLPGEDVLWDSDLKRMLSEFSSETPMLIVMGSCYSGRFITSDQSISTANRIIVAATHDDQESMHCGF